MILSVSSEGRYYWKCPTHGWSEFTNVEDYVPQERAEFIEPTMIWGYVVPRHRQRVKEQEEPDDLPLEVKGAENSGEENARAEHARAEQSRAENSRVFVVQSEAR